MLQFYALSVFANILAGFTLVSEYLASRFPLFAPLRELLMKRSRQAVVGIAALVVGFLKLLLRATPTDVPVVGDLFPALVGLAMGATLLFHVIREKAEVPAETMNRLERVVLTYRTPMGFVGIAVGLLHFLLPGALLL